MRFQSSRKDWMKEKGFYSLIKDTETICRVTKTAYKMNYTTGWICKNHFVSHMFLASHTPHLEMTIN